MYEKEPQLKVAYYGPSIPPLKHSYHRLRNNGGCNCCRFFSLIVKLILTIIIIISLVAFFFLLIVGPNTVKFHVTDATLTQFNYTGKTLHYDLTLNIIARNSDKLFDIYYDNVELLALFHNARFHSKFLSPFYKSHKTTKVLKPVFKGQQVLDLNIDQIVELKNTLGIYNIDVKMYLKTEFELSVFNYNIVMLKSIVNCNLHVPLKGSARVFKNTKCVQKLRCFV